MNGTPELGFDVCFEPPKIKAGFVTPPWFVPSEPNVKRPPKDEASDPNANNGLVPSFWPRLGSAPLFTLPQASQATLSLSLFTMQMLHSHDPSVGLNLATRSSLASVDFGCTLDSISIEFFSISWHSSNFSLNCLAMSSDLNLTASCSALHSCSEKSAIVLHTHDFSEPALGFSFISAVIW